MYLTVQIAGEIYPVLFDLIFRTCHWSNSAHQFTIRSYHNFISFLYSLFCVCVYKMQAQMIYKNLIID